MDNQGFGSQQGQEIFSSPGGREQVWDLCSLPFNG
jgi:hypothetical protein